MPPLNPGDVLNIIETLAGHEYSGRYVCVCDSYRCFLRIVDVPVFGKGFPLGPSECPWMHSECFVELRSLLQFEQRVIRAALMRPTGFIGQLSDKVRQDLVNACNTAPVFSQRQKYFIQERLLDN